MRKMDDLMQQIKNKALQFKPRYTDINRMIDDKDDKYVALFDELNKEFADVDWYFQSKYLFLYLFNYLT
jgi:hypothetical protein